MSPSPADTARYNRFVVDLFGMKAYVIDTVSADFYRAISRYVDNGGSPRTAEERPGR